MNRQEFEDTARRYRDEMIRLYARLSNPAPPPPRPENRPPVPPPPPSGNRPPVPPPPPPGNHPPVPPPPPPGNRPPVPPPPPPQPRAVPAMAEESAEPETFPQPDQFPPEAEPQPDQSDRIEQDRITGGIRVYVRTARGALPVPGAIVTITRENGAAKPELIAVQTADDSGDCPEVTVPAPESTADQQHPAYYAYDITVSAAGFYREHSAAVPVFAGVVSVQNFDLIPLPAGHDDPYSGELTVYNDLPAAD